MRKTWKPKGALFNPKLHEVKAISESEAKHFVKVNHYSQTYPAARFRVGLLNQGRLVGCAVFSVPASQKVISRYVSGLNSHLEGVELGRLVLLNECAFNAETWFLSRAFKMVRRELGVRFILSYSDPVARFDLQGRIIKPPHYGQIYQALNASYFGRASRSTLLMLPNGRSFSPRALSKIRNDERGKAYAVSQLVEAGAPEPLLNESGADYVTRVSFIFRKIKHPGNLAYCWFFDKRLKEQLPRLPYEKGDNQP